MKITDESDAELDADSGWVGAGDLFSVYIRKTDEGVVVDIYARGCEDCNALASCYAFNQDALDMQEGS